jgi:hypothetical protein
MLNPTLDVLDGLAGITFVPLPIEVFGHAAELDNQITGQVLRFGFAALLPPEPEQSNFIVAHDDPRVRTSDEESAIGIFA